MKLDLPDEVIALHLEEHRRRFQAGNAAELIAAIRFCFNEEIVPPEWIVNAFFRATNDWYSMRTKELGEAFGVQWPKGKSFSAAKKKRRLKWAVDLAVTDAKMRGVPIDNELFASIGKKLGLGVTLVKEYYASARQAKRVPMVAVEKLLEDFKAPTEIAPKKGRKR